MAVQTRIPLFFFALSIALPILSADPDPLQDFCVADLKRMPSLNGFPCKPASKVTSKDFFFRSLVHSGDTSNMYGSKVAPANVLTFPAVNTLGISMNRVDLAASGGINPPHSHPRAAEIGVVIQGEVAVGFVTTAGEYYSEVLRRKGEVFVVPRGVVHFQLNVGKTKAILFTAFNSQLPGAVIIPTNLFGSTPSISNQVLTRAFKINETVVDLIKSRLSV